MHVLGESNGARLTSHGASNDGHIQLIVGPMFSGKTTELIRRMRRYDVSNHRCYLIKYAKDDRYDAENVSTHDQAKMTASVCLRLADVEAAALNFDVIGVDEGQFFPDVVCFAEKMAGLGKVVIVAALDGTYQREGFPNIMKLLPLSESIIKLMAVCMVCYREAAFTKRIGSETEVEIIGGTDKYMAVCRKCYNSSDPKSAPK
ncbi:thymidine kinase, cytosolic [Galendromus occidentalis]|uniref:Thymidine kinase n=1 Tax=Galendromus occidentalis TaxID=34638 RepID=A0AAJ6VWH7_9ACAR|nr:thymidine kinase, cytosolic [Galendromus occidentalis]